MNPPVTHEWDPLFVDAAARFLEPVGIDWRWLKSQGWQESRFNRYATSEVGAVGPMQFMPDTWDVDVLGSKELDFPKDAARSDPEFAIVAGAWYDRQLWNKWTNKRRLPLDRIRLMLASYNAGFGRILKAQGRANMALEADKILAALPPGANARQTVDYVARIEGYAHALGVP